MVPLQVSYWDVGESDWMWDISAVAHAITWAMNNDIDIINYREKNYPKKLLEINDFPIVLYYIGNIKILNQKNICHFSNFFRIFLRYLSLFPLFPKIKAYMRTRAKNEKKRKELPALYAFV